MIFEDVRQEIIAVCLELAHYGYLAGTGGNVACRIDDEHFAITPSASDYYSMVPQDICVLRLTDLKQVAGESRPSVEHRLHAYVLQARADCRGSIHTHQPIASAFTLLGRDLEIQDEHRDLLGPRAALVSYAPSGTNWLASKLRKALRPDINAYLLRNHGVVCCGPTLRETVHRVKMLELACSNFFHDVIAQQATGDSSGLFSLLCNSEELEPAH